MYSGYSTIKIQEVKWDLARNDDDRLINKFAEDKRAEYKEKAKGLLSFGNRAKYKKILGAKPNVKYGFIESVNKNSNNIAMIDVIFNDFTRVENIKSYSMGIEDNAINTEVIIIELENEVAAFDLQSRVVKNIKGIVEEKQSKADDTFSNIFVDEKNIVLNKFVNVVSSYKDSKANDVLDLYK